MKTISVDIDEKDLDELGISEERITLENLKRQILIQSIRKQREMLERINQKHGFNLLSEEEIFNEVNRAEHEYGIEKNS